MILELKDVKKSYKLGNGNEFKALKGINVSFKSGELVSIIGESGSGKSTLMNLIGGLDLDFSGNINLNGKNVRDFNEKELDGYRKNKIGFVFQSFNLISHLSILDNVTIAMTLSNVSKKERILRAKQILDEVGLNEHIDKKPNQLSGGQKQRVAIARALINDPDIILADEPTGSLDSDTSKQILEIITKIADRGKLVIMVTHSEKVANISGRVITISDGLITSDETKKSVETEFIEDTKVNKDKQNLSFISSIKLALNNMKEKKTRNILISLGASIGIMSVVIMLSLGNGIEKYMNDTMGGYANPLVVEVNKKSEQATTAPGPAGLITEPVYFDAEDIKNIERISNVSSIEKAFSVTTMGTNKIMYNKKEANLNIFKTMSSGVTSENIASGSIPKNGEILLGESLLEKLDSNIIGKEVTVQLTVDKKQVSKKFVVSGIYSSTSSSEFGSYNMAFINYSDLEKIAEENSVILKPTTLYLTASDQKYTDTIKKETKELGYIGSTQEQILEMFTSMIEVVTYVLSAVAAISLLVSSIMILVVLYISVVERTREIGVLKAIGARRKDIKRIFTAEAFLIGALSGTIGIIIAFILGFIVNEITIKMFEIPVVSISYIYVILGIAVSIIISTIAGVYPASKASKLDPIESLRHE